MSGTDHEDYDYIERREEMFNHQARIVEKMAETLVLCREFVEKFPDQKCCEKLTLDSNYRIFFRFDPET